MDLLMQLQDTKGFLKKTENFTIKSKTSKVKYSVDKTIHNATITKLGFAFCINNFSF